MLIFLGVSVLVIVVPGQDTALTIRNALLGSRRAGVATALGIASGLTAWTIATSIGLAALIVASEPAFLALRLAGAAYLGWLGLQALWSALSRSRAPAPRARRPRHPAVAFRQGLVSNLGNPKILVFFTSLLPQFSSTGAGLLVHGLIFCALTLAWLTLYALAVAGARRLLDRAPVRRAVDAVSGVALVGFGALLATERR